MQPTLFFHVYGTFQIRDLLSAFVPLKNGKKFLHGLQKRALYLGDDFQTKGKTTNMSAPLYPLAVDRVKKRLKKPV